MGVVLACDLGGTSFRAALVDREGRIRRNEAVAGPSAPTSEIDPAAWWQVLCEAVDALADDPLFGQIRAIAVTGVTRTQVFLGPDGAVLRPAMTWRDTRAEAMAEIIAAELPADHPETSSVNAFHPAARLFWLRRHEPEVLAALAAVLEPKDYLNFQLTGELATDAISSARLLASASPGPSGASLLDAMGLRAAIVPRTLAPTAILGRVLPGLPGALSRLSGQPVLAMANDTWAAVLGLGALRDGYAYNLSGTTEVFGLLSSKAASAEGLMSLSFGEGLHHLGGPSQNGGDTLVWALSLLSHYGGDPLAIGPELDALLAQTRDRQPLLFLPYLQGERTPYWDPALRGAYIGLNRRHRPVDCAYAVLEGIAFLNRIVLERAEAALGQPVREVRFGGGGAANAIWCQIKADICGRPFVVTEAAEPGLVGSAIAAWQALGAVPSLAAGQEALVRTAHRYEPRREVATFYARLFGLYRASETALRPISRALSEFGMMDPGVAHSCP